MIISELLRLRYSLAGRVLLAILLAEAIFVGLLLAFLPNLIDALITLNEVIPNATSADQFTDGQLAALTLASPQFQVLIADLLGNAGLGASLPAIAATLLGALTITAEFRRGSITGAVLAQPIRWRLILAKMTALVCAVTGAAIVLAVLRVSTLGVGLAVQAEPLLIELPDLAFRWALGILSLVLYSLLGLGIGLLIRNQIATISVIFAGIAIESIIRPLALLIFGGANPTLYLPFGLVPDIAHNNPLALLGADAPLTASLSAPVAIASLAVWAGVLLVSATVRFSRADVPAPN
ncbi:hypothetical protein [Mycetocola reblochoni]|uniref:hypothetical protein n=1 Tax=Mycetocola reblochoni TaxID=331618 RepID=UPI003F9D57E1